VRPGFGPARIAAVLIAVALVGAACSTPTAHVHDSGSSTPSTQTSVTGHPSSTTAPKPPRTWSAAQAVSHSGALSAVSCPTTTSCVALTDAGLAYNYAAGSWKGPVSTGGAAGATGGPSLSCSGPSFCMAMWRGGAAAVAWNGVSWSAPVTVPGAQSLEGVGCASPTFCVAVDGIGAAFYFNGSSWSEGSQDWGSVTSISCPNAGFCISVAGGVSVWNGSSWTEPQQYGTSSVLVGVSCPYISFCAAVDSTGQAITYNGQTWTGPQQLGSAAAIGGPTFSGISCSGADFCVAVNSAGEAFVWNGRAWSAAETADAGRALQAIACTKPTFCVATDASGHALART
jgi:hypothetical protein